MLSEGDTIQTQSMGLAVVWLKPTFTVVIVQERHATGSMAAADAGSYHTLAAGSVLLEQIPCALHFSHTALEQNSDRHSSQAEGMTPCNIKARTTQLLLLALVLECSSPDLHDDQTISLTTMTQMNTCVATRGVQPPEHVAHSCTRLPPKGFGNWIKGWGPPMA